MNNEPTPTSERPVFTEEMACGQCSHQMYDHDPNGCRVRISDGTMRFCKVFRFKKEGTIQ